MTTITKAAQQALDTDTLRALVTRLALEIDPEAKLEAFPEALAFQIDMARAVIRAALQDKAGEVRDNEVLRQVFALCEDTEGAELSGGSADSQVAQDFMRGRKFEAKQIRRAIGTWFQDEFCGRSFMGEPATDNTAQPAPVVPDDVARYQAIRNGLVYIEPHESGEIYVAGESGVYTKSVAEFDSAIDAIAASQQKGGQHG